METKCQYFPYKSGKSNRHNIISFLKSLVTVFPKKKKKSIKELEQTQGNMKFFI